MTDLSKLMQNAAILEVIDQSADEASNLSAQNSYQAQRIEELERELADEKCQSHKNAVEAMCLEAENAALLRERCEANDACLKEITRAEKAEAENAALKALLEEALLSYICVTDNGWRKRAHAAIDAAKSNRD